MSETVQLDPAAIPYRVRLAAPPRPEPVFIWDIETRSEADLKKLGAVAYFAHPSTCVYTLAGGWLYPDGQLVDLHVFTARPPAPGCTAPPVLAGLAGQEFWQKVLAHLAAGGWFCAHNAEFELAGWGKTFPGMRWPPLERVTCTVARVAACGLPMGLEAVAEALNLPMQKDMAGNKAMKALASPQKATKTLSDPWRHHTAEPLATVAAYCRMDVLTQAYVHLAVPMLSETEQAVWVETCRMNQRGIPVDQDLAGGLLDLVDAKAAKVERDIEDQTEGRITGEDLRRVAFLRETYGLPGDALDKAAIAELLKSEDLSDECRAVLEARSLVAKSSLAKLKPVMLARGGRVLGTQVYHGAGTGRWSGRRLQPHNLPRDSWAPEVVDELKECLETWSDRHGYDAETRLELIESLFGGGAHLIGSRALRGVVCAPPGRVFYGADLSQIEARGSMWLAGDPGLELFRTSDPYVSFAAMALAKPYDQVTRKERNLLGKPGILSCQYQAWAPRVAEQYGLVEDVALLVCKTYRQQFRRVVRLWSIMHAMACAAMGAPGAVVSSPGDCKPFAFFFDGMTLWLRLPSGRKMAHFRAEIRDGIDRYDRPCKEITYWICKETASGGYKWVCELGYGGKWLEHLDQAMCRDIIAAGLLRVAVHPELEPAFLVHDECNAEADESCAMTPDEYAALLTVPLPWTEGLPLAAEGWRGRRYRK